MIFIYAMNGTFTDEDFNFLATYERTFRIAKNEHYFRGIGSVAMKKMAEIYQQINGKPYPDTNFNCGSCALKFICTMGGVYEQMKASVEAENKMLEEKKEEAPVEEKPAKKKATPKKKKETK